MLTVIIGVGGRHGGGRTTIAKLLAKKLRLRYVGIGNIFREMAEEKGMSIEEFNKYVEAHPGIDKEADKRQIREARKGGVVLDSNLGCKLIKKMNLKVWLTAPEQVRAKRIIKAKRLADTHEKSIRNEIRDLHYREESEQRRYNRLYGIDLFDLTCYDLIINTQKWKPPQIVGIIARAVKTEVR